MPRQEKPLDVLFAGTALVDSIVRGFDPTPVSASGFRAASGTLSPGGEAVNGAVAAAKLGLRAGILCSLGTDGAGELVASCLRQAGVDITAMVRSEEHPTPVSTLLVREDGTRQSITNAAHRYNFHPEQYPEHLASARILVLGSLFRAPFDDPAVIRGVLEAAGDTVVFADTKLPNFARLTLDDLRDALPRIDYIFPNEDEARFYSGKEEPEEMADVFLRRGVKNVVIKLGGKGCFLKNRSERIRLDAYRIDPVDATGAGDNFIAGFASALLSGASHREALRFANACGAICATAVGASAALEGRDQVRRFMEAREDPVRECVETPSA